MKDEDKTKEQLINELVELGQRVAELEAADTERKQRGQRGSVCWRPNASRHGTHKAPHMQPSDEVVYTVLRLAQE